MLLQACFTFAVAVTGATAQSSSTKSIWIRPGVTVRPTQIPSGDVVSPTSQSSTAQSTFIRPGVSMTATVEPCARVSSAAAAYSSAYPSATAHARVPADMAFQCLQSVPLHTQDAVALVDSIMPYMQWQSTLAYLRSPLSGYMFQAIDLVEGLKQISQDVVDQVYETEYDFEAALYSFFQSARDSHLNFVPDGVGNSFRFEVGESLVSVSAGGQELPKLYLARDIQNAQQDQTYNPSPIVSINKTDATSYIETLSMSGDYQDLDALYNSMFSSYASINALKSEGNFRTPGLLYPGLSTDITFANGTTFVAGNAAKVVGDFSGVDSGEAFYKKFCNPKTAAASSATATTSLSPSPSLTGYPVPMMKDPYNQVAGFFLNGTGYEDVAVLAILGFAKYSPATDASLSVQNFLAACKASGKKKLVVDVSANPGGTAFLGYDIFKQLFPSIEPFGAANYRAHESLNRLGQIFSAPGANSQGQSLIDHFISTISGLVFQTYKKVLAVDYTHFTSWQELYGPRTHYGDQFTSLIRYNLSDPTFTRAVGGLTVSGYGNRSNVPSQPFDAKNIIMLTDGLCGSTCSLFTEFMTQEAGVKTAAAGGRPAYGPMQVVGGSRGSRSLDFQNIYQSIQAAEFLVSSDLVNTTIRAPENYTDLPMNRSAVNSPPTLNFLNSIRKGPGNTYNKPLQFLYQAADCRIFYTPQMIGDVTAQWKTASQIGFSGNTTLCVKDSTGNPTVNPGNGSLVNTTSSLEDGQAYDTHTTQPSAQASQTATQATDAPDTTTVAAASDATQASQGIQAAQTPEGSSSSSAVQSPEASGTAQADSGRNSMGVNGSSTTVNGSTMAYDGAASEVKTVLPSSLIAVVGAVFAMVVL